MVRHEVSKSPVARALGRSALGTVNLLVAGSATALAAALHAGAILALGGVAYGALVAWDLANPGFWKQALKPARATLPAAADLTDRELREVVRSLGIGRSRLDQVLAGTPEHVKGHLAGVLDAIDAMEASAARLVKPAEELTRYLATTDAGAVRLEMESLAQRVETARDAVTRQHYESARQAREEQLRSLGDIAAARERVMANLARMVATQGALAPRIVRMRALDAEAMDALSGTISDELERIHGDMRDFEETLRSLGEAVNA